MHDYIYDPQTRKTSKSQPDVDEILCTCHEQDMSPADALRQLESLGVTDCDIAEVEEEYVRMNSVVQRRAA